MSFQKLSTVNIVRNESALRQRMTWSQRCNPATSPCSAELRPHRGTSKERLATSSQRRLECPRRLTHSMTQLQQRLAISVARPRRLLPRLPGKTSPPASLRVNGVEEWSKTCLPRRAGTSSFVVSSRREFPQWEVRHSSLNISRCLKGRRQDHPQWRVWSLTPPLRDCPQTRKIVRSPRQATHHQAL